MSTRIPGAVPQTWEPFSLAVSFCKMNTILSEVETRVLGSLIEKDLTTPEYYPLSLNALVHACNQKSNRHPLMNLDADAVRQALRSLNRKELAGPADNMDSRVSKFEHRLQEAFNFTRHELAILCELLLRGPQTPGELRSRADRMHRFEDLGIVQSTLARLMKREPPLAKMLPRQPGTKEVRYAHLLSGDMESLAPKLDSGTAVTRISADSERLARLEHEVAGIQKEVADLKQQLTAFQKQFE